MKASSQREGRHLAWHDVIDAVRRLTATLRPNERNFDASADVRGAAFCILSPDGHFVSANGSTGAIFGCPAHDQRDLDFARKYDLPVLPVVLPSDADPGSFAIADEAYVGEGTAFNSGFLDGLTVEAAKAAAIERLQALGFGEEAIQYRLRDWGISRQRYWGEPIPIVNCDKCGAVAVDEKDLPILLPKIEEYHPTGTGESPLAAIDSWVNVKCPKCKGPAKRETNTMPQWAGSCWYYLRFMDSHNEKEFVSPEIEKVWSPIDLYIGGAEHAVLHLLYARFWHKVLYDLGLVSGKEPFKKLVHQGMILSYAYCDKKGIYRKYSELDIKDDGMATLKETGETIDRKSVV